MRHSVIGYEGLVGHSATYPVAAVVLETDGSLSVIPDAEDNR
jgi:hypothetical protein